MTTLTSVFYLALSAKKVGRFNNSELNGRLLSKQPALARGEVCMKLTVQVPSSLFQVPALRASVSIPENAAVPTEIDATVIDNVQEILRERTGLDVVVTLDGGSANG